MNITKLLFMGAITLSSEFALSTPATNASIGETPTIENHMSQQDIEMKEISLNKVIKHGQKVFDARFNELDGRGRPATTGGGAPRDPHGQPEFLRTSGPDANSCAGCHSQPRSGGAGDFVANVFVLAQTLDPVTMSVSPEFSNERNTLGMFGAGAIEMLAREMTDDLIAIRESALELSQSSAVSIRLPLMTKGISFGHITVTENGLIDPSEIEGIDWDLIVKPFHQKGAVVSLREFTNNAMNHHHGIQTTERFGEYTDPDQDGIENELSAGDVTATTVFQAALPAPSQKYPTHPKKIKAAKNGEKVFADIGCGGCHVPELTLSSRKFSEPNPYNPSGNLTPFDVSAVISWDMTKFNNRGSLLKKYKKKGAKIRAFTDLKRHNLCDNDFNHFCNEQVTQGNLAGFADPDNFTIAPQPRPTEEFLTRKLWDVANSDPYGHRGDLSTMTEAINQHGGAARTTRDTYFDLSYYDQASVIEFLKTMGVFDK